MSGIVQSNIVRSSGTIAVAASGLNWDSAVITASTLTAEGGKGYFINTTSNICTITLPSAAEAGDQIVFVDYARTWGTYKIVIDSNGLNYQGDADTFTVEYNTSGETLDIVYSGASKGWIPQNDDVVVHAPSPPPTQKAIIGFGALLSNSAATGITNLVNSSGVVASDTAAVGSARTTNACTTFGGDKAIFAFGYQAGQTNNVTAISNLVNSSGVVASDTAAVGTARYGPMATGYGADLALFAFGRVSSNYNIRNLVSNQGVVASDATGAGTARYKGDAVRYGSAGQAVIAFGGRGGDANTDNVSNLVSNVGVVASDTSGVGTARIFIGAVSYGGDKGLFAYGEASGASVSMSNKISNQGVVASDVTGVAQARKSLGAAGYGGDKGIFAFGNGNSRTNLVSNSGVVASEVNAVGSTREDTTAGGFSTSA